MPVSADWPGISSVVGEIYDSAIDPAHWPKALKSMCRLIGATHGAITTLNHEQRTIKFASAWGGDPIWMERLAKYAPLMPFYRLLPLLEVGDALNTSDMIERLGEPDALNGPFFKEWAEPAGFRDVAGSVILRSGTDIGMFTLHTPVSRDYVGSHDLAIARLLAPHVRRAVLISDLLEMRSHASATFEATLDMLSVAVVLTGPDLRVLYANPSAIKLFRSNGSLGSKGDKLRTSSPNADLALASAVYRGSTKEWQLGYGGVAVPITSHDGSRAIAHVLPLNSGPLRTGMAGSATTAVFLTSSGATAQPPFEALAGLFDLTPTEARVMLGVASGKNRAQIATSMSIAEETVKTHLARIFLKTHTKDQSGLARLVSSMTSPATAGSRPTDNF
jgi:DNA-binding CsgD family transcriptional regulator/PAS domain-containing protein